MKQFHNYLVPNEWEVKKIGQITKTVAGGTPDTSVDEYWGGDIPWMSSGELNQRRVDTVRGRITAKGLKNSSTSLIPAGCVLIGLAGQGKTRGTVAVNTIELCTNQSIAAIFPAKGFVTDYLFYNLDFRYEELRRLSTGDGGRGGLNLSIINGLSVSFPSVKEQMAIAHVLGLVDRAIDLNNKITAQKELRKKWLMQTLLTGRKRLKGYGKEEWKLEVVKRIVIPVRKPLIPNENEHYQQIGIRSHTKGIFYKEKVLGSVLGDKSVFWVEPNCFILNIVFAWEHAIAKTTDAETGMIASHRFPMFKPKVDVLDLDYFLYYFASSRGKYLLGLASPGGAGRNKTLGKSEFLELRIPVPPLNEQAAIVKALQAADREIQFQRTKSRELRELKKGMMQQLLTGKKRLNLEQ
ncbi:MAG: restriction endonuclease subunit S [Pyrinomonadaceae bacterium]